MANYKVVKGDTLSGIAKKFLGNPSRYPEIKKLNNLKSDTIRVGQILKIPDVANNSKRFEEIGKAFDKALKDVENLESVKALKKLVGG